MAELPDRRREQFCRLCALGMGSNESYVRSGFRKDKSNASKLRREPEIVARIDEIQLEEADRLAKARADAPEKSGLDELKAGIRAAAAAGNWAAVISGSKALAENDGSFDALGALAVEHLSDAQLIRKYDALVPPCGWPVRLIAGADSFEPPPYLDRHVADAAAALRRCLSPDQLHRLSALLLD